MDSEEKNLLENKKDSLITDLEGSYNIQELATYEKYESIIPHPDIFKGLSEVDPTFPERVMKMTEDNNKHEIRKDERNANHELIGQIFSFTLGIAGLGISAFLATKGLNAVAITAALSGITPIIIAVIANLGQKNPPK